MRRVPVGRPVPQADEPEVGLDHFDPPPLRVLETKRRPADTGLTELRALLAADEKRRQEAAAKVRRQGCRQLIERVKERVVKQWSSPRYTIPAETQAQALREIERELSAALAVNERPEWELVRLAEGIRETLYGPVMRAQDEAQRQEEQRGREAQEEARRAADQRIKEARERQQAQERVSALIQYGTDFASAALREVEDLEARDRQSILEGVAGDLKDRLTGGESKRDVQAFVDTILDEELGEADEEEGDDDDDEYVENDDAEDDYEDEDDD
jgi:hypothetical protein